MKHATLRHSRTLILSTTVIAFIPGALAQGSDDCAAAVAQDLTIGSSVVLTGDNSTANGINDFVVGSPYEGAPVYWVKFTTDACANVSVAYCGQSPLWGNTLSILASTCPADQLVNANAYNEVDCGDGNRTYFFNELPAGTWAIAVLNDPGSNSSGAFSITVAATACVVNNDLCATAVPEDLPAGGSVTFDGNNSTAGSTNDFDPGSPYFGAPVNWHAFTTDGCNTVQVAYCGTTPAWTNVLGILATDCPALNLVNASSLDNTACGNGNTTFTYGALPAGTYYLPVLNDVNSGSSGDYSIEVSATACPVSYDLCANVVPLALSSGGTLTLSANNSTAGSTNDFDPTSPYFGAPVNWHAFTTTACNDVTVAYCGTTPSWSNVLGILATDCPALTLVNATNLDNTVCGDGNTTFTYSGLPAGTYYLPVLNDVNSGSSGDYTVVVGATACIVNHDFCFGLPTEELPPGGSLTFTGDNTNATGLNDFDPGSPFAGAAVNWHKFHNSGCANVTVHYCGIDPVWANVLGILATDCPAMDLVYFSIVNTTDCSDGNYTYVYNALAEGDYNLPVLMDPLSNSFGPYSIEVLSEPCPDDIDQCSQVTAQQLAIGGSLVFAADNSTATGTGDFVPGNPFDGAPITWHLFTTTECADVAVSYCGIDPVWGTTFGWLTPDCPADSLIYFSTFSDTTCGDGNRIYYWNDLAAGTYAVPIVLDAANGSVGPYSVEVSADDCLSTGVARVNGFDWSIAPNPTEGEIVVRCGDLQGYATLELVDATGRLMHRETTLLTPGSTVRLSRSGTAWPVGTYALRITTAEGNGTRCVVVR